MIFTFDSSQVGAPVLSGTAGALRTLLKACLVDGFGAGAVATLTVSGGIATATYAGAHPFKVGYVAQFAGASPEALNGDKVVLPVAGNSVTFAASGVPDGAATGTITSKAAPVGWQELFAGTQANVIALKPSAVEATGCVLRVDDSAATLARAVGYLSMADVSSGTGPFPTSAQFSGGVAWPKSNVADGSARAWRLVADARSFMLYVCPHAGNQSHGVLLGWGDFVPSKSGDAYACAISGVNVDAASSGLALAGCLGFASGTAAAAHAYVARSALGVGSALLLKKTAPHNTGAAYSGGAGYNGNGLTYPNVADNSLRIAPVDLLVAGDGFRGVVAGLYHSPQVLGDSFSSGDLVQGQGAYAGRTFMALRVGPPASTTGVGVVFVDVAGPWR